MLHIIFDMLLAAGETVDLEEAMSHLEERYTQQEENADEAPPSVSPLMTPWVVACDGSVLGRQMACDGQVVSHGDVSEWRFS